MRMTRVGLVLTLAIGLLTLPQCLLGAAAPPAPSANIPHEDLAIPSTPEARQELWTNALQALAQRHLGLSEAKRKAIDSAAELASPILFGDDSSPTSEAQIAVALLTLKHSLSAAEYQEVLTGFQGLLPWLQKKGLVATDNCDCNNNCADGYKCASVTCIHEAGTTNNGICQSSGLLE